MKLSLKVEDQHRNPQFQPHHHNKSNHQNQNPLLLRAKIPITVFGLPFLYGVAAADPSDLSFCLRTNFPTGPSLKLSYTPSLQLKPQFGDFSLCKTTYSAPNPNPNLKANGEVSSMGFVPLERPVVWTDLSMESCNVKDSILSGISVRARTAFPVTKRVAVNCRWGVNFPSDFGKQLPFLTVNKIGIERVDEVKQDKEVNVKRNESNVGDLEVLKGMCFWMRRELDFLQKENREMKHRLEEMKLGHSVRNHRRDSDSVTKKSLPVAESSGGFEQWRSKKSGGEDNGRKESKKSVNQASDVASELERAIKAASSQ
uniref:Uncharacterized protein n=1 Tax=Davidia involucrata TaxID=16924 RepID=A0A5B7ATK4_DAVIN